MSNEIEKSEKSNTELWNRYKTPDLKFVKDFNISGQKRKTVDAQYKKWLITKAFGIHGKGWGVVAGSEKYERIHYEDQTCILQYTATAFYKHEGELCKFPIAASIKEAQITNQGKGYLKIDDEAIKKVRTDAITKGFTDLGFTADIYLGLFDDQDYLAGVQLKEIVKAQDDADKAVNEAVKELSAWVKTEIAALTKIKSDVAFVSGMDRLSEKVRTRANVANINPAKYIAKIDQLKEERKNASK